ALHDLAVVEEDGVADLALASGYFSYLRVELVEEHVESQSPHCLSCDGIRLGHHLHKPESTTQSRTQQVDASVGRVHGADQVDVGRHSEFVAALGQANRQTSLVHFEKGDQLAEHLRDVAPIDLIDDQDVAGIRIGGRRSTDVLEEAVHQTQLQAARGG